LTGPETTKPERVPRADKLNLVRDILHLLDDMGGTSGRRRFFYETRKKITKPDVDFSVESTFNDYLIAEKKLGLMKVRARAAKITRKGQRLVSISKFGDQALSESEKRLFRSLLFAYFSFRAFLIVGFCEGKEFINEDELYCFAKYPEREVIVKAYMKTTGQNTDREARTLLGWAVQVGLTEFDEYSGRYYLVKERHFDLDTFLKELRAAYLRTRSPRTKMALIPEVRFIFCSSTNSSRSFFDGYLLELHDSQPSKIQLAKASSSRQDVLKFGLRGKTFYYYYIRLV